VLLAGEGDGGEAGRGVPRTSESTQPSSSASCSLVEAFLAVGASADDSPSSSSPVAAARFRFLGFFSPLKRRADTIVAVVVGREDSYELYRLTAMGEVCRVNSKSFKIIQNHSWC